MSWLEITLVCVIAAMVAAWLATWLFKKDTEKETRRRIAAKAAGVLRTFGLTWFPDFLEAYAVGDYSGMLVAIKDLCKVILGDEEALVTEFSKVFERVLTAKLKTETGRAYVAAKLEDAMTDADATVITEAPKAGVV